MPNGKFGLEYNQLTLINALNRICVKITFVVFDFVGLLVRANIYSWFLRPSCTNTMNFDDLPLPIITFWHCCIRFDDSVGQPFSIKLYTDALWACGAILRSPKKVIFRSLRYTRLRFLFHKSHMQVTLEYNLHHL